MAPGASITLDIVHNEFTKTLPYSATAGWQTIIDAGGMIVQDSSGNITNPDTGIASSRHPFNRKGQACNLVVSMGYNQGISGTIVSPVIRVFGRTGADFWRPIRLRNSTSTNGTVAIDTVNDANDGTLKWTTPDFENLAWDCTGYEEIVAGVQTILSATGTVNTALLVARFI